MIKIAIVEDEELYMKQLLDFLEQYKTAQNEEIEITVYRDGDDILSSYKAQFDLILMDIEMKFVDGMAAAKAIRKVDSEVIIIFITNMTQYAIRGYEVGALDYILKPVSYFMFVQKLNKALECIKNRIAQFILIPIKGGVLKMDINNLYYIESQGHMLHYHTLNDIYSTRGNMKEVEESLEQYGFFRSNKGYLINMKYVESVMEGCCIVHHEKLPIARVRRKLFMEVLTRYISEGQGG